MSIRVGWSLRPEPLPVVGVVGLGALAAPLLERARGAVWKIVKGPDITVLLGPADELPFLDGVRYVAQSPDEPSLLHPPMLSPDVAAGLVLAGLVHTFGLRPPVLFLPREAVAVSLAHPCAAPPLLAEPALDEGIVTATEPTPEPEADG